MQRPYDSARRISENNFNVRQYDRERRIDRHIGESFREDRGSTMSGDWRSSPSSYPSITQPRIHATKDTPTDNYDYRPYVNENSGRGEIARLYHRAARGSHTVRTKERPDNYESISRRTTRPIPTSRQQTAVRPDRPSTTRTIGFSTAISVKEYKEERAARRQAESDAYERTQRVEETKAEKERIFNRLGSRYSPAGATIQEAKPSSSSSSSASSDDDQ